jgi:hypothetical protein
VLDAIKAVPFGWPPKRPALTASARGSVMMSPVGAKKRSFWSNKETCPKCLDIEHPIQARFRLSTAPNRDCP